MSGRVLETAFLAVFPPFVTICLGILTATVVNVAQPTMVFENLVIWVSMSIGMCILPFSYLCREIKGLTLRDVGVSSPSWPHWVGIALVIAAVYGFKAWQGAPLLAIALQNIPIALAEEFWTKGVLFRQLREYVSSTARIVIVSACIFGFVTHAGQPLWINLLLRVPMGLLMGVIYVRTHSIAWPAALHLAYNSSIT